MNSNVDANATTTPAAHDAQPFPQDLCDALFAAVLVHDDIDPDAELPDAIHLDYSMEQLVNCYRISRQIWKEGVDRKVLSRIIRRIDRENPLTPEDQLQFKHVRARFKHLRAAYVLIADEHRHPAAFQALTAVMGFVQDAIKNGQGAAVRWWGLVLRLFLTRLPYALMTRKVDRFRPGSVASFQKYAGDEIGFIRSKLGSEELSSKEFHDMRKVISRQVALYDNLKVLYPSPYHRAVSRYLSTINGLMGSMHDELVVRKFRKPTGYYADTFVLPEKIRHRLLAFTQRFPPPAVQP